ncbi:excisionase [Rhizobium puerariae]|uniref:Excisionase n=1 Tax=Rhizobium puerariae TaxID=1585791 RepID=A0ABV6APB2_9HYPH
MKIDPNLVTDDMPLRLKKALELAFPHGGMTVSGLRTEIRNGNLAAETIAGKQFTTLNHIKAMRAKCRANQKGSASGSASERDEQPSGSSSTDRLKSAQDALQTMSLALIGRSKNTSLKDTSRTSTRVIRKA